MSHAAGDRLLSSPNRTEKTISSLDSLLHLIFQTQNHIQLHSFYSLISFKIAGILTWLWGNPSPKTMCNAYINNPMHTSNASRYFTKITRRSLTHLLLASHLQFSVKLFLLLLLLFLSSFYHQNQLPLPGKLYCSVSAGSWWKNISLLWDGEVFAFRPKNHFYFLNITSSTSFNHLQ